MSKHYNPFDNPDESTSRDDSASPGADFQVDIVMAETDMAIQVLFDTGDHMWIPKSVIHPDSEIYEQPSDGTDGSGTLIVHTWFAEKQGLL